MNERRRSERIIPNNELFGRVRATVPARILDISAAGVQVEIPTALRPSVECDFSIPDGTGLMRLRARVRRCRAASLAEMNSDGRQMVYRAGLEFDCLTQEQTAVLDRFVHDAQNEMAVAASPAPQPMKPRGMLDQAYLRLRSRFLGED